MTYVSAPIRSHLDDFLHQVLLDLFYCDVWGVLDRDDNCVHTHRNHSPLLDAVLHCNLHSWRDAGSKVGIGGEEEGWEWGTGERVGVMTG